MTSAPETVLVTGSAGFIGSHVVDRLLGRNAAVIGVDNFDPFYPAAEKHANIAQAMERDGYLPITADCSSVDALEETVPDLPLSAIVHLAAKAGVRPSLRDPVGYVRANVLGTQSVLEFARRRGVDRIVFASSSSVYGDADRVPFDEEMPTAAPISPYAATKRAGELLCATHAHLFGAGIVALRFFTAYGPRQRPDLAIRKFASLIMQGRPLPFHGDGSTARDYTWIDDIVDGVVAALDGASRFQGSCEIINLGGSRMTSLSQLVELLQEAIGLEAKLDRQERQPGDVTRTCANTEKAERLLGYAPKVTIEEGIPRFVRWFQAHAAKRVTVAGPRLVPMAGLVS